MEFPPFGSWWHGVGEALQRKEKGTGQEKISQISWEIGKKPGKYIFFWLFNLK